MATNDFGHVSLFDMCAGFFCRKDFCTKPRPMRQEKSIQTWTSSQVSKDHGGKGSHPGYSPCREISRLAKFVSVLCSAIRCWQGPDVFTRCVCIYIYISLSLSFPHNSRIFRISTVWQLGPSTLSTWPNTKEAQTATSSSVAKSPALYHAQGTFHRALQGQKSKGYQSNIWISWSNQPAGQPHACEQLPEMSIHCMKLDYNRLHTDVCQFHGSWSNTPRRLEELHKCKSRGYRAISPVPKMLVLVNT